MEVITKVIICGSRTFNDWPLLKRVCLRILSKRGKIEIVEGGARGADALGAKYADTYAMVHTRFTADWDTFGRKAGYIRNNVMGEYAEFGICIAFWDGKSPGTAMMIALAKDKYNMETWVYNYKENKLKRVS